MKYLIPHFVQEKFDANELHGSLSACTLFLDLSGFTPLTEALMNKGNSGAEELSIILNDIFGPLVHIVYTRGGFVPYFAGDAFSAIFPENSSNHCQRACLEAALEARAYFQQRKFQFGNFTIGLRIGLSHGDIEWGIVGRHQRSFYFRGRPIDQSALCQAMAKNEDFSLVIDETIRQGELPAAIRAHQIKPGFFYIPNHCSLDEHSSTPLHLPSLRKAVAARFLPEAVVNYQQDGEFRSVITLFISFTGIETHRLLNRFAGIVLEQMYNFSGYFKEIDFGDKGGVLVGFFGAPVTFENNVERALEFVYALDQETSELRERYPFQYRVGITQGTAYTGIVGGQERCQYAAVGNRVNLAARLMMYADWGEVLVDSEIRKHHHFRFQHKGDIQYKGIHGSVPTFKLTGKNEASLNAYDGILVGRDEEIQGLIDFAQPLFDQRFAGVATIYGEAGIGKSRLTYELRKALEATDQIAWHSCQADQILKKPFNPFVYFLRNYFQQSPQDDNEANLDNFERRFSMLLQKLDQLNSSDSRRMKSELIRTKSVLAALLGIVYFDSLWEQLDAKGRYQNTIQAIINLFRSEALIKPCVIELEDAHWLDDDSRELISELLRYIPRHATLLLITSRYQDDGSKSAFIPDELQEEYVFPRYEVDLNFLSRAAVRQFAEYQLGGPISDSFLKMLLRTTNSNPFYLQQLLEYFIEQELLNQTNGEWVLADKNVQLSSSINAVLTARIDRLSSLVKETVKAAAVIGREFEVPILNEVMKSQQEFTTGQQDSSRLLAEQIQVAEDGQIWRAMSELRYIFRHSLLREAAYSMQLRTRLQQLHQSIAEAIERLYPDKLEERYVDLAFHYEQAGITDKMRIYLRKAADYARRNFQNHQALEFYEKLLEKLNDQADLKHQIQTLLHKGRVQELIGEWDACTQTFRQALALAKKLKDILLLGAANNSLGQVLVLKGEYDEALVFLQRAEQLFASIDNLKGMAGVKGNLGNLYFRQGDYDRARLYFQDSIDMGRSLDPPLVDAQIVANLGLTYMNRGEFKEGIKQQQEHLLICEKNNDRQGAATIHTYMGIVFLEQGDHTSALKSFRQGLKISEELGNKHLLSIGIGNVGVVYERQGDYNRAMEHYVDDLELCEQLGDKQGTAIALALIGQLLNIQGEFYKAIEYLQKSLMISEELNYRKGIGKAVNTLGDIFYYLKQYDRSLHFYDRAIEVARSIGNKLVLGNSLVEKGAVLLEAADHAGLRDVVEEALDIAKDLGNPDLLFEARLLQAQSLAADQHPKEAQSILYDLLTGPLGKDQQAAIYYELYRIQPDDRDHREKAREFYEALYAETPRFTYEERLEELKG